ncbi:MAG: hypothetical protein LUD79_04670 [Oscillospiraceae bacterium]|nr:hypothetical protein [Oscillospiraceae bacterium]
MSNPYVLLLVKVLIVAVLAFLWVGVIIQCLRATRSLQTVTQRMKQQRMMRYPQDELHPTLVPGSQNSGGKQFLRTDPDGVPRPENGKRLPDVEEEKRYPYYLRTGHVICNATIRTPEEIVTGRWYGYGEWVQDMIGGRWDPEDFCGIPEVDTPENTDAGTQKEEQKK